MDLSFFVSNLRDELAAVAEAGGDDARALAERLTGALDPAMRLILLDVLSVAAEEITRDLAPGSVHLQLVSGPGGLRVPSFAVTLPDGPGPDATVSGATVSGAPVSGATVAPAGDDGATARINFRLGEQLKARIEAAAEQGGLSVNGWLTRAAAAALEPRRAAQGADRLTGWVR